MAIEDDSRPHRCLKITLTVLYSIGVALTIIYLVLAVIALAMADHEQSDDDFLLILSGLIAVQAFCLLFDSTALFAIVKENKDILAVSTLFQVVFCCLYLLIGYISIPICPLAIGHAVMAIMLGVFTYIVFKRQKSRYNQLSSIYLADSTVNRLNT